MKHYLFEQMRGGRPTSWWLGILVAIPIVIVASLGGAIIFVFPTVQKITAMDGIDAVEDAFPALMSWERGVMLGASFFAMILFVALWRWLYEKRGWGSFGTGGFGTSLFQYVRGLVFGMGSIAVMAYGLQALGHVEMSDPTVPTAWLAIWPLLILFLGWSIQGSAEEFVFRGLLFQSIGARNGLIIAAIISSVTFSLLHGQNPNTNVLFFANLALYSLFACAYALREGGIWGICGHHVGWNFAQGDLFGFAVSGQQLGQDKLMTPTITGPDLITGGATGFEGGLATAVIIVLSAAVLLLINPPRNHDRADL